MIVSRSVDEPGRLQIGGMVAVVTGGAGGMGRHLVAELLRRDASVVIADVESDVLDRTVDELSPLGKVIGVRTDVSNEDSVAELAERVYDLHGRCNLLFNNAGVTSGGGGLPWQQEPNDWRWCFGVNVFGVAIGVSEFVPRMIAGGEPGQVINTSSGDGGFAPVRQASVYAASKAAVSCFTETLQLNLIAEGSALRASVFYPSGGLMDTGLYTASRNRPEELARKGAATGRKSMTFAELKDRITAATGKEPPVADLDALAAMAINGVEARDYVIAADLHDTEDLLHARAEAIGRAELPPEHRIGI